MAEFKVFYYLSKSGKKPVNDFIDSLQPKEQTKFYYLLELLKEYGSQVGMPHIKRFFGTPLWELRIMSKRMIRFFYASYSRGNFIVLHGFIKKSQKTPPKEIRLALKRLKNTNGTS